MASKKWKNTKHINKEQQKTPDMEKKSSDISEKFVDILSWAFTNFDKIDNEKRINLYGDQKYLDQFWEYFKEMHPNLLDQIDKNDLPIYMATIEKKWFTLSSFAKNAATLHREFSDENTEKQVMEQSLSDLKDFCETPAHGIDEHVFRDFARFAWFDYNHCVLDDSDGKLTDIGKLSSVWKEFLKKEKITLPADALTQTEAILLPEYNPIERIMITVVIDKIKKTLKWSLRDEFNLKFPTPITVFSSSLDLISFKDTWIDFLWEHESEIDEDLAKKLDAVIVTNGDIKKALFALWKDFDDTTWFSQWEQYFRRLFNKLVTRQLFEDVQKKQETIDTYIGNIGQTFVKFPPYIHSVFDIYPFNALYISALDTSFSSDITSFDDKISSIEKTIVAASEENRVRLRQQRDELIRKKEERKWQWYIAFLRSKDQWLSDVFAVLVASRFDFSLLSLDQQQVLTDVLVKHQLEDTIKNKVPELLSVSEEEITQFVHDLFDLNKMELEIPTRDGKVPLIFTKKWFMSSGQKNLLSIQDIKELKNLPLNFAAQLTSSNASFFEDSPIFNSLYYNFSQAKGDLRINDSYKVRVTKNGKPLEWYLSSYCPIDKKYNDKDYTGGELFLYSQPVTQPDQERTLLTWDGESGGEPVVIKADEQQSYDVDILDRQINFNGEALWALLFSYIIGQQSKSMAMSAEKEKELWQKLGDLDVYKDKATGKTEEDEQAVDAAPEAKEKDTYSFWKELSGYGFPEEKYKENGGFVEWSRLYFPFGDSGVPPVQYGSNWIHMDIIHIDEKKWTFKVKMYWGEMALGKFEWTEKELPMRSESFSMISEIFGAKKIYKMPPNKWYPFEQQFSILESWWVASDLTKYFSWVNFNGSKFTHSLGNYSWKEITHFGVYDDQPMGEKVDQESWKIILYKVTPHANGTITVSGDGNGRNYVSKYPSRTMDYATFLLFIQEKKLKPKCTEEINDIYSTKKAEDEETKTTVRPYSIMNIVSFFKNSANKVKDAIKKNDDERTEDLTDVLTQKWQLRSNLWSFLSPFEKISGAFENMWIDSFMERDNRVYKKIEKRVKFYEDYDYTKLYNMYISPMLNWTMEITPHYKIAAMLLVNIKKAKWPYGKHAKLSNEGKWIGKMFGNDHQQRYLAMREKRIRNLEENASKYWGPWADQQKNELAELEMRYIVHVMDGRHMWMWDDVKYYFQDKYSKKFCDELETAYTWFYKQDGVNEWFTKNEGANFEFARVEYFRQLADRPQQALPYLKVMATKAVNDTQWQVFESAVLAGMLSGVFLTMTFSQTQSFIQKICRTRGYVPGIFSKDIHQQTKIQRLLDIFSGDTFSSGTWYSAEKFGYRTNIWAWEYIGKKFVPWIESDIAIDGQEKPILSSLSNFLSFTWTNTKGQTLVDIYAHKDTSLSDKLLIKEFMEKSNEKDEELDNDVEKNTSSLTWSILTKSQSVVHKMIDLKKSGFNGKDGDEIQNMKQFSENMEKAIPKNKLSATNVKFFLEKFFNRFGEKWFSGNAKTKLLKRLFYYKTHPQWKDAENLLFYSIVGEILRTLAPDDTQVPDELLGALWAWKDFFKVNIDTILSDWMVNDPAFFGSQYAREFDTMKEKPPLLVSRWEAAVLLDRKDSATHINTLDPVGRKAAGARKREISKDKYLNKDLYELAESVEKKYAGYSNKFKLSGEEDTSTKKQLQNNSNNRPTWAYIKNKDVLSNLERVLENKPLLSDDTNLDIPYDDYNNDYNDVIE